MRLLPTRAALLLALIASAAACGKLQAKAPTPMPALDMPAPPGRLIIPTVLPEPPPEPAPTPPASPPSRPPSATTTRPAERPAPPTPTPTPEPSPTPTAAPVLQTTPDVSGLEQKAQAQLDRAKIDLQKVSYKNLNADARLQYDTAWQYIGQAQDALKMKNYVFANQLAEKAAVLANLLVKSQGGTITSPTFS